jgi:hypothetical protein
MRLVSLAVFFCVFFSIAQAQGKNDLSKDKLAGNVKELKVTGYRVANQGGKFQKTRAIHTVTSVYNDRGFMVEFNSSGGSDTVEDEYIHFKPVRNVYTYDNHDVMVSNKTYNEDGSVQETQTYHVDNRGNRIDWNTYKGDGTIQWHYSSEYDNEGHLIEANSYYLGNLDTRHLYKYDGKGNDIEETVYDAAGKMKWKETMSYDSKGNITEIMDFKGNGSFNVRKLYLYDDKGNVIEEREYATENATKYKKTTNKYDAEGNMVQMEKTNEAGKLTMQCKMDRYGNHTLDVTYRPDGKIMEKITQDYKYDDKGNITEQKRYYADGTLEVKKTNVYSYDKMGNWFINISYMNDQPVRITERKVEYY